MFDNNNSSSSFANYFFDVLFSMQFTSNKGTSKCLCPDVVIFMFVLLNKSAAFDSYSGSGFDLTGRDS